MEFDDDLPAWSSDDESAPQATKDPDSTEELPLEIEDFTNASEWESFIAEIEAVLRNWGLANSDVGSSKAEKRGNRQIREHHRRYGEPGSNSAVDYILKFVQLPRSVGELASLGQTRECFAVSSGTTEEERPRVCTFALLFS